MTICDTFDCVRSGWHFLNLFRGKVMRKIRPATRGKTLQILSPLSTFFLLLRCFFGSFSSKSSTTNGCLREKWKLKKFLMKNFFACWWNITRTAKMMRKSRATNARGGNESVYTWNVVSLRRRRRRLEMWGRAGSAHSIWLEKWKKKYLFTTSHTHSKYKEKKAHHIAALEWDKLRNMSRIWISRPCREENSVSSQLCS